MALLDKHRAATFYVVAVHVLLIIIAVKSGYVEKGAVKLGLKTATAADWTTQNQKTMDALVPSKSIVFLGDSHTEFLQASLVHPKAVNFGIRGQRSDQLLARIGDYTSLATAESVIVTIGTNDMLQGKGDALASNYEQILAAIPESVHVYLVGIPPSTNFDFTPAHAAAKQACASKPNCIFVDGFSDLRDPEGRPKKDMLLSDGTHLSREGYAAWIAAMKSRLTD